jgi:hypothetical protein
MGIFDPKTDHMNQSASSWKFFSLLALTLFMACGSSEERPALSTETMGLILTDIHLADAMADQDGGALIHRKIQREELFSNVFEKHSVDRGVFWQSYKYYLIHPEELDSVYSLVLNDLTRMEMRIDSVLPERKKIRRDKREPKGPSQKPPLEK